MIADLLKEKFPFINDPKLKEAIISNGKIAHFNEGEMLIDIGDYVKIMPLITKGSIKVMREDEDANELLLYYVDAGNTCAMTFTCCMQHSKSQIRAVCEEDVEAVLIPVKFVDEWMMIYADWKSFIMRTYASRFEEMLHTIDALAFLNMDERLWKYLMDKSKTHHSKELSITHQNIAYDLNSSREVISRVLKRFEKEGKLKLGRNKVTLQED